MLERRQQLLRPPHAEPRHVHRPRRRPRAEGDAQGLQGCC